jgi:hypothetical protein
MVMLSCSLEDGEPADSWSSVYAPLTSRLILHAAGEVAEELDFEVATPVQSHDGGRVLDRLVLRVVGEEVSRLA